MYSEPVRIFGEGEYNLNNLKEVEIKESFLHLDEVIRECQVEESFLNCTTRHTTDIMLKNCGCLPFNVRVSPEVAKMSKKFIEYFETDRYPIIIGTCLLL